MAAGSNILGLPLPSYGACDLALDGALQAPMVRPAPSGPAALRAASGGIPEHQAVRVFATSSAPKRAVLRLRSGRAR